MLCDNIMGVVRKKTDYEVNERIQLLPAREGEHLLKVYR